MRTRQASGQVQLRWRCGWMFLSVPQTCPSPPSLSKLPKPKLSLRIRLSAPSGRTARHDQAEIPPNESSEFAYTRSGRKVNCYQSRRGRFWSSCDISATKPAPIRELADVPHHARKLSVVKGLVGGRRAGRSLARGTFAGRERGAHRRHLEGILPNPCAVSARDFGTLRFFFFGQFSEAILEPKSGSRPANFEPKGRQWACSLSTPRRATG